MTEEEKVRFYSWHMNGWRIVKRVDPESGRPFFYAIKGASSVKLEAIIKES